MPIQEILRATMLVTCISRRLDVREPRTCLPFLILGNSIRGTFLGPKTLWLEYPTTCFTYREAQQFHPTESQLHLMSSWWTGSAFHSQLQSPELSLIPTMRR